MSGQNWKIEKFWMVWRHGARAPNVKHETLEAGYAEAKRLSQKTPGKVFVVLETAAAVVHDDAEEFHEINIEDLCSSPEVEVGNG